MRKTKLFLSDLGTGADQALSFPLGSAGSQTLLRPVSGYNRFLIDTIVGSVRVKGSINGVDVGQQLSLSEEPTITADVPDAQVGTVVAKTTAGRFAWFTGDYRGIQVEQVGATAAQVRILAAADA